MEQLVTCLLGVPGGVLVEAQAEQRGLDLLECLGVARFAQGFPGGRPLRARHRGQMADGGRRVVHRRVRLDDRAQGVGDVVAPVGPAVLGEHRQPEHGAPVEHHDVPGRRGTRRVRAVRCADGVLFGAGDPGGGEQESLLCHGQRLSAQGDRRDLLVVEPQLVVHGSCDEPGRPLHLFLVLVFGVVKQEEEVGVERDPVAATEVAVGPEVVQPAVHSRLFVVPLQGRLQRVGRAVLRQERRHRRFGLLPLGVREQRCRPLEESLAALGEAGYRHPGKVRLVAERTFADRHGHPRVSVRSIVSMGRER